MPTLKHTLRHGAAVLALAVPCFAAAQTSPEWTFVYKGFDVTGENEIGQIETIFIPTAEIRGRFFGVDGNANGVLEKGELTSLSVWGDIYLPCYTELQTCSVNAFSYSPDGGLSFDLSHTSRDPEGFFGWSSAVVSGVKGYSFGGGPFTGWEEYTYAWTPQTTFTLTGPVAIPVPEPSTWLMLGAGALLLGWRQRRRLQA